MATYLIVSSKRGKKRQGTALLVTGLMLMLTGLVLVIVGSTYDYDEEEEFYGDYQQMWGGILMGTSIFFVVPGIFILAQASKMEDDPIPRPIATYPMTQAVIMTPAYSSPYGQYPVAGNQTGYPSAPYPPPPPYVHQSAPGYSNTDPYIASNPHPASNPPPPVPYPAKY